MGARAQQKKPRFVASSRPLWQHVVALGVILLVSAALFLWAGYTFLPDATTLYRRQIVNDDYTTQAADGYATLTSPLGAGGEVRQRMRVEGRLYGLRLDVATYDRVARGTLHLRLVDENGAEVTGCDVDMTQLLDNTFHPFIFDGMLDAGAGGWYTLVVTATPETPEDVLGFYHSDGPARDYIEADASAAQYPLDDFTLAQDGVEVNGTLALQYITHYAGTFIVRAYAFFAAVLCVFLLALYAFIFIWRQPLHRVFVLCALVLGCVFVFLTPLRTAPDEYVHIATSYHYTNVLFGTADGDTANQLMMRAGDAMYLQNYDFDATDIFAWQDVYENLFTRAPAGAMQPVPVRTAQVFPLLYTLPTAGMALGRLLGLGRVGILMLGRLANLVFYTLLVSRAIKRLPLAKPMLFVAGLLPMALQLAASFSYDTWVIALSFYYIATCLDYALVRKQVGIPQVVLLGVVGLLLAPAKTVYIVVVFFMLIIPRAKFSCNKAAWVARAGVLGAALVVWAVVTGMALGLVPTRPVALPQAEAAGASAATQAPQAVAEPAPATPAPETYVYYTPGYILTHLPQTVKLVLRTLWEQGPLWLQGLIGGRLGEIIAINIEVNWLFVIGLLGVLLCSALPDSGDTLILSSRRRGGALTAGVLVFLLFLAACITWTPTVYETVFGVQGRYLLPVLPLLLLALRGANLSFTKPVWRQLCYAAPALTLLCQLNAFVIILGRG